MNTSNSNKDHLKIIITDSGLGGLSVHAYLDFLLEQKKYKPDIDLIFFNALYSHDYGYNSISSDNEKAKIFNDALISMSSFHPDYLLIACNTLSVIYPKTRFYADQKDNMVYGIIDFGVKQSVKRLNNNSGNLVILGTATTINSGIHRQKLIESGVEEKRIIGQACNQLESEIQINPLGNNVKNLIEKYLIEAKNKCDVINDHTNILLACTHYDFVQETIKIIAEKIFKSNISIINPNKFLADYIIKKIPQRLNYSGVINNKVYSRVDLLEEEKKGIGEIIENTSPNLYIALMNYNYNPNLF